MRSQKRARAQLSTVDRNFASDIINILRARPHTPKIQKFRANTVYLDQLSIKTLGSLVSLVSLS